MKTLFITLLALAHGAVHGAESPLGEFVGQGPACYGKLSLSSDALAWRTTFSQCSGARYKVIAQASTPGGQVSTIAIDKPELCGFSAITLESDRKDPLVWVITGYRTLDDVQNTQLAAHERLVCTMRKEKF